jgi:hypothetical protein
MGSALAIAQLVESLAPSLIGLITQAIAAAQAGDQATLDALHAQATAAANALKPAGA